MSIDRYTRAVLTVIALALCVIALRGISPIATAQAAETMECRFGSPVEVRNGVQIRVTDTVNVKLEDFGLPGSSSGSPLYVKQID